MRRSATLDCLRIRRTGERSSSLSRRGKSRTNVLSVVVPLSLSLSRIPPFTSTSFLSLSSFHSPLALFLTSSLSLYSLCYVECKRKTGYTLRLDILHVPSLDIRNKPFHCSGFSLFPPFFLNTFCSFVFLGFIETSTLVDRWRHSSSWEL